MKNLGLYPFVSVVVPARDEAGFISVCLESLVSQSYPRDRFEVILVDNGSVDETLAIAGEFSVRVLEAPGCKIGAVRNKGVQKASRRAEVVAFIDADCQAPKDWLLHSVEILMGDSSIGAVGGYFRVPDSSNWLQYGWAPPSSEPALNVRALATGSFFLRKETFDYIGGFNEKITAGEDMELSSKIAAQGLMLLRVSCASVYHLDYPATVRKFLVRQVLQSKNYFDADRKGFDAMLVGVSIFLTSYLLVILFLLSRTFYLAAVCAIVALACCGLLAGKRLLNVAKCDRAKYMPSVIGTTFLYLTGRSWGLLLAVAARVKLNLRQALFGWQNDQF